MTLAMSPIVETTPRTLQHGTTKLQFLDGLRALSALYVVCFHAATVAPRAHLSWPGRCLLHLFLYGHYAVGIFIVVSGYCLMLPVAASPTMSLRGGVKRFAYRRAKRILPPYYAALLFSIAVSLFDKHLKHIEISAPSIVAHLLLLHNVNPQWATDFNGVLWTVATEWQIYFIFALVLLPLNRSVGIIPTVVFATILGLTPYLLGYFQLFFAAYWYLGLFAIGMAAAQFRFAAMQIESDWNPIYLLFGAIILAGVLIVGLRFVAFKPSGMIVLDYVVGPGTALLIAYCGTSSGSRSVLCRALSSGVLKKLGLFSYSLYLIHFPIISTMNWVFKRLHQSDDIQFTFAFLVVIPTCVVLAYLFFLIVERPFLTVDRRGTVQVVPVEIAAP